MKINLSIIKLPFTNRNKLKQLIMKTKNKVRIYEKPKSLDDFRENKIDGSKIYGGCLPAIIFCFLGFCPALRTIGPDLPPDA